MILYKYSDQTTNYLNGIRKWFPTKSLPVNITEEVLSYLGVVAEEVPDPVSTLAELKEAKKAEIAEARYEAEIAGVTGIRTDRESQSLITGATLKAMQDPEYTCRWKKVNGFQTLDATQIIEIADAVRAHVQACFDREAELLPLIDKAETQADLGAITYDNT